MRILLLHPGSTLEAGPWSDVAWDLVIDLGWSGRAHYARQSQSFRRILSVFDLCEGSLHGKRLREALSLPLNRLIDSHSIDWWDIYSGFAYTKLEQFLYVCDIRNEIARVPDPEVFSTHPHPYLSSLSHLLQREIKTLNPRRTASDSGFRRAFKSAATLPISQTLEIAFDKWDIDYRLRRHFASRQRPISTPVILLPSAYSNVTRTQAAFARMIPDRRFLLLFTRRNSLLPHLPSNIESRSLSAYATPVSPATKKEFLHLRSLWQDLVRDLSESSPLFDLLNRAHEFGALENFLRTGLRIRDAWLQVLTHEPIVAVLSADENNPYTRLPTLLAKQKRLPTVFSDHGALNMTFTLRPAVSDVYLMRNEMAFDYSTGSSKIPPEKALLGAPPLHRKNSPSTSGTLRDRIVFYSEAYELSSIRTQVFYAELLPQLCQLARSNNRRVIIKLHPFESGRERTALIDQILSSQDRSLVEIREGPMTPDLFARAWCSFTLESSVAVESTLAGVPCFLCSWFDVSWYGYAKQFAKFGAGHPIESPDQIQQVPQILQDFEISEATLQRLQTTITAEKLESIFCAD
jgi:hypothetical protein